MLGKISYLIFCLIYFLYVWKRDQAISASEMHLSKYDCKQ